MRGSVTFYLVVSSVGWTTIPVQGWHNPSFPSVPRGHYCCSRLFSQVAQYDAADDDEDEFNVRPYYPTPRAVDASLFDLTGGRPGAVIETEEQLATKQSVLRTLSQRTKTPGISLADYGESVEDEEAEYDTDDPDAIDAATLGSWTIQDIRSRYEYEYDPREPQTDPNRLALRQEGVRYLPHTPRTDDGVEVGYDPIFGPSHPMDQRTILGAKDSFMIDERTRDESLLAPLFPQPHDPEVAFNEEIVLFRQSLDIIETYVDPFLGETMQIPRHVAKWHGYPEQTVFEPKPFTNNRFTDPQYRTQFNDLSPYRARQRAVELARAKNAEWMPEELSRDWHRRQRQPYENYHTLIGTLRRGDCDENIVQRIQPALQIFGSCAELLSINEQTRDSMVFRFHYHGLMKNRHGMKAWMETLLTECLEDDDRHVSAVFETGFRRRDAAYDGGDPYYGVITSASPADY